MMSNLVIAVVHAANQRAARMERFVHSANRTQSSMASLLPLYWETDGKTPELVRVTNVEKLQAVTSSRLLIGRFSWRWHRNYQR